MSRFDSPISIVLLFTAAAAISVLLILLLNAEAKSRKSNREPEIRNGNIFSELGSKLKDWMAIWFTDNNSTTTEVLVIDTSDWEASTAGSRRLQWVRAIPRAAAEDRHRVRHGPKHARAAVGAAPHSATRRLGATDACYDTNEVLAIIGLTCVVNLAFVAAVLCLVHTCGRHKARWPGDSVNTTDGSDVPLLFPTEEPTAMCCRISSYSTEQEYVNSFHESVPQLKYDDHRASSRSMEHLLFIG